MADRRPLNSRSSRWAGLAAAWLVRRCVSPNRISQASILFAALAALAFWRSGTALAGPAALLLVAAAVCCQLRLLCNLLDGMVAIEGGRGAPDGPFWNEMPDRVADLLILAGAGLAVGAPALGLAAGAGAVLTAYVRELGRAEGAPADFSGPMAKPHRMAALTGAALLCAVELVVFGSRWTLLLGLWVVTLGTGLTVLRRSARLLRVLNSLR